MQLAWGWSGKEHMCFLATHHQTSSYCQHGLSLFFFSLRRTALLAMPAYKVMGGASIITCCLADAWDQAAFNFKGQEKGIFLFFFKKAAAHFLSPFSLSLAWGCVFCFDLFSFSISFFFFLQSQACINHCVSHYSNWRQCCPVLKIVLLLEFGLPQLKNNNNNLELSSSA